MCNRKLEIEYIRYILLFCIFFTLHSFREMESPAVLIKKFQALQEERVHTYKSFDEYVYLS